MCWVERDDIDPSYKENINLISSTQKAKDYDNHNLCRIKSYSPLFAILLKCTYEVSGPDYNWIVFLVRFSSSVVILPKNMKLRCLESIQFVKHEKYHFFFSPFT